MFNKSNEVLGWRMFLICRLLEQTYKLNRLNDEKTRVFTSSITAKFSLAMRSSLKIDWTLFSGIWFWSKKL